MREMLSVTGAIVGEGLTDKQRQFVFALIQTGCSQSKAAELAGYAGGPDTWKAMGWRLAHDARLACRGVERQHGWRRHIRCQYADQQQAVG